MRRPATVWTKHISDQDKRVEFEKALMNSSLALSRFRDLLIEKLETLEQVQFTDDFFEKPNWEARQAKQIGRTQSYREMLELLSFLT